MATRDKLKYNLLRLECLAYLRYFYAVYIKQHSTIFIILAYFTCTLYIFVNFSFNFLIFLFLLIYFILYFACGVVLLHYFVDILFFIIFCCFYVITSNMK